MLDIPQPALPGAGIVPCLLGALAALSLACADEPPPEPVRPVISVVVGGPSGFDGRWWPGRAKATQEVDLGFEVSGQLEERLVNVGDEVTAGDVMARLDPRDYRTSSRAPRPSATGRRPSSIA